jgi:hypothetical protein
VVERTIYVELLDEAVDVWRPVSAVEEAPGIYRLPATSPVDETWAFEPGRAVRCEPRELSDGLALVAVAAI